MSYHGDSSARALEPELAQFLQSLLAVVETPDPGLALARVLQPHLPRELAQGIDLMVPILRDLMGSRARGDSLPVDPKAAPCSPWARAWKLSPRHAEVAAYLLRGLSDKEIAEEMKITFNTCRTYVRQVYKKVGVHGRLELVQVMQDRLQDAHPSAIEEG